MPDSEGRPARTEILDLAREGFGRHATRINNTNDKMAMVERRFKPFLNPPDPKVWKPIIPGTAASLVHRVAAQVVTDHPVVTYEPMSISQKATEHADLAEKFGAAILGSIAMNQHVPPFVDGAKRSILGMWAIKGPLFDFAAWGEAPKGKVSAEKRRAYQFKQANNPPFIVESIDPNQLLWDETSPFAPKWVIQKYMMPKDKLKTSWPAWGNPQHKSPHETVEVIEYWSENWKGVIADDEWATYTESATGETVSGLVENIYGFVPYQIGFGTWGFAGGKPEDIARSMLDLIEDEIYEEARVLSLMSWAAQLYGLPTFTALDPEAFKEAMKAGPGAVVPAQGEDIEKTKPRPLDMPTPPAWLEGYANRIKSQQEGNTISRSAIGEREAGMTSGIMSGIHIGESKTILRPIVNRLSAQASTLLNRCAWIHENLVDEPMSMWLTTGKGRQMVTVKPEDWKGQYHFDVDMEPVDPTRDDRRFMLGLNALAQGGLDPWTFLQEYARHPDASGVIKKIMKWRTMNSPEFAAAMAQMAAQESGFDDLLQEVAGDLPQSQVGDEEILDLPSDGGGGIMPGGDGSGQGGVMGDLPTGQGRLASGTGDLLETNVRV